MQGVAVVCGILWDVFVRLCGIVFLWCWQGNHLLVTAGRQDIISSKNEGIDSTSRQAIALKYGLFGFLMAPF